jgi:acylphosphatase
MAQAHVFVDGKVQGVYFRDTTRKTAEENGVEGWVRNLSDGRVEAVFQGDRDDVEAMIDFCHEGPPRARVEGVDVEWVDEDPDLAGFRIRSTK